MKLNSGKLILRSVTGLLCAATLWNTAVLTAAAAGGPVQELPADTIDIADTQTRSGDGWAFDHAEMTYTITGDVTVAGTNYDGEALVFNISGDHIITWQASYVGRDSEDIGYVLIAVTGNGGLVLEDYGYITLYGAGSAVKTESGVYVIINSGGSITADGEEYGCVAIQAAGSVSVFDDGEVWAESDAGCTAIYAEADVTVDSSRVVAVGPRSVAIRSGSAIQIEILGNSRVWAQGGAVLAKKASVMIDSDTIIDVTGALIYAGGEIYGNAVMAKDVAVWGYAKISARNGAAVFYSGELDIHGGVLAAYGDGVGGASFTIDGEEPEIAHMFNVIFKTPDLDILPGATYTDISNPESSVSEEGIALAWNFIAWYYADEPYFYEADDKTDLFICSDENAGFGWSGRGLRFWYETGENSGTYWFELLNPKKPLKPNPKPGQEPDPGDNTDPGGGTKPDGKPSANTPSNPGAAVPEENPDTENPGQNEPSPSPPDISAPQTPPNIPDAGIRPIWIAAGGVIVLLLGGTALWLVKSRRRRAEE